MAGWGRCRRCQGRIFWGTNPYNAAKAFPFDDDQQQRSHFESCSATEWVTNTTGDRYRVAQCRACKARVWWDTTPNGKRRPMDVEGDVAVFVCHLETCVGVPGGKVKGEQYDETWAQAHQREPQELVANAAALWLAELGLSPPCTLTEATSAFRRLALTHHPDMGGSVSDFVRIRMAYDRLKELLGEEVSV